MLKTTKGLLCFLAVMLAGAPGCASADADSLYRDGREHLARGKLDEAIEAFQLVIGLGPGWADAYDGLGWVYLAQGELDEAEQAFREALSLDPDLTNARDGLETIEEHRKTSP